MPQFASMPQRGGDATQFRCARLPIIPTAQVIRLPWLTNPFFLISIPRPTIRGAPFLGVLVWVLAGLWAAGSLLPIAAAADTEKPVVAVEGKGKGPDMAVFKNVGSDPAANVRAAIEALGGMGRFVGKGNVVVVKPNMAWDRTPEQAANTNPAVVAALVKMALEAGAKQVKVFDNPCANQRSVYARSGIEKAATDAGATVFPFDPKRVRMMPIPGGEFLKEWPVSVDALDCDCYINVPIAKHHGLSRLTLGMKNAMGIVGGNRGQWHQNINVILSDFLGVVKPKLTVIDAWRILTANGPSGGDLKDVKEPKTVVASVDPVAADAWCAAKLFGFKAEDFGFITRAAKLGHGTTDFSKLKIVEKG